MKVYQKIIAIALLAILTYSCSNTRGLERQQRCNCSVETPLPNNC